jgi:hypothetical protein
MLRQILQQVLVSSDVGVDHVHLRGSKVVERPEAEVALDVAKQS